MSLLEGGRDHKQVYPVPSPYGMAVPQSAHLQLDGVMDIAVNEAGDTAYAAGSEYLYAIDVSKPQNPVVIGRLAGIRNGRQIEVSHGLAAVTCRADGVFFCDVQNASKLKILSHYDTIELATGVCISGNLCFITCRHYGVEIVDITNPVHPVHVSNVLAGEAQSVFVDGTTMYVGAWMERQIRIFDISDPSVPKAIACCELDGFGDGIFVRNGICFAATGHHARRLINRRKYLYYDFVTQEMLQDGFGGGHGLEIFDVSNPMNPVLLSRLKTPPLFMSSYDLWDVQVAEDYAFLSDTYNGMFIVNIADPRNPAFEGYRRLEPLQGTSYRREPTIQQLCHPVTGFALLNGYVLAASVTSGLHVLQTPYAKRLNPVASAFQNGVFAQKSNTLAVYQPDSQIHGVVFARNLPVLAAGDRGMIVLDPQNGYNQMHVCSTSGTAIDIKRSGGIVYLAEGLAGLSIWQMETDTPKLLSRLGPGVLGDSVRQIVLLDQANIAALQLGTKKIAFILTEDPENPKLIDIIAFPGTMYYKGIVDGFLFEKYAAAIPLSPGMLWFEIDQAVRRIKAESEEERQICPIEEGACFGAAGIYSIYRGQYYFSASIETTLQESNAIPILDAQGKELYLSGKPTLIGNTLCLLNRQNGLVTLLDVQTPNKPVVKSIEQLYGNPEQIILHDKQYWICLGHGGLQKKAAAVL